MADAAPELIIFDCDGVLIDSELISAEVLIDLARDQGLTIDRAYVRDHFLGRSFPTVAATIRDQLGVALPPDFEAAYRAELLRRFETRLRPTPGIKNLLDRLAVPACVATSSSPPRVARSLAMTGLDRYFGPHVFTASLVARGKPAPDLFLHAARAMRAEPARCLVIEDSRPGTDAARNAGMPVLLYTGGSHMDGKPFDSDPPLVALDRWDRLPVLYPAAFGPSP